MTQFLRERIGVSCRVHGQGARDRQVVTWRSVLECVESAFSITLGKEHATAVILMGEVRNSPYLA